MAPTFTAHNIRLPDGSTTLEPDAPTMDQHPWFLASRRILDASLPGDRSQQTLVDLGCLEGGYTVEFARLGFQATGVEVRSSNFEACTYVQDQVALPNLSFVQDDVLNLAAYGPFDVTFCSGLFYHLDNPRAYLKVLGEQTRRVLILQTHVAPRDEVWVKSTSTVKGWVRQMQGRRSRINELSALATHEGMQGRWYPEFRDDADFEARDDQRWASWDNRKSFWPLREDLFQMMYEAGFTSVLEMFDHLQPNIAHNLRDEDHQNYMRGMFIGLKV